MTKKNKNIITISVIAVLIICIIVTVCFAKDDKDKNIVPDKYFSATGEYKISEAKKDSPDDEIIDATEDELITSDTEISRDEELDDEKITEDNKKGDYIKKSKRGKVPHDNQDEYKRLNYPPCDGTSISTKYVILLCFETFLLGSSVMYLIMNNIDKEKNMEIKNKVKR